MPTQRVDDLKTVVTEACNNVVLHAYPGAEEGPLEVTASASDDAIEIEVQDQGSGFQPSSGVGDELSLGLGLPLIAALSDSFEISGAAGKGTRMRMRFELAAAAVANGTPHMEAAEELGDADQRPRDRAPGPGQGDRRPRGPGRVLSRPAGGHSPDRRRRFRPRRRRLRQRPARGRDHRRRRHPGRAARTAGRGRRRADPGSDGDPRRDWHAEDAGQLDGGHHRHGARREHRRVRRCSRSPASPRRRVSASSSSS